MMYLDHLFYQSIDELLELPAQELDRKKHYATTLLACLDSVSTLKDVLVLLREDKGVSACHH